MMEHEDIKVALIQQVCTAYRAKFFEKLSERLAQNGFKLTVFFGKPQRGLAYSGIIPNPKTARFNFHYKVLPRIAYEGKLPTSPFDVRRSLILYPTLIFEIGNGNYSITISDTTGELLNTFPLLLISKFILGRKFIIWCGNNMRDNAIRPEDSLVKKIAYVFARQLYKHCDASIACGPGPRRFDIYMGTDPDKISIALNTVDIFYFEETIKTRKMDIETIRSRLGVQGKNCILYVGSLEQRKRVVDLILAFKEVKRLREETALLLIGDGPHRKFLEELCSRERISDVHFLGKIDYADIPLYYALSELFVLPGQGGIAVAEAMASSKPVIITEECNALRSIPNLVKDGENGFVAKSGDVANLTQQIVEILSDAALERRMGMKSRQMAEKHFSTEGMLQGFEQAIYSVVASHVRQH